MESETSSSTGATVAGAGYETPAGWKHNSAMSPREAFFSQQQTVPVAESTGCVCATDVSVYPPGIPILYPGEEISQSAVDYIQSIAGKRHVHGIIKGEGGEWLIRIALPKEETALFNMLF